MLTSFQELLIAVMHFIVFLMKYWTIYMKQRLYSWEIFSIFSNYSFWTLHNMLFWYAWNIDNASFLINLFFLYVHIHNLTSNDAIQLNYKYRSFGLKWVFSGTWDSLNFLNVSNIFQLLKYLHMDFVCVSISLLLLLHSFHSTKKIWCFSTPLLFKDTTFKNLSQVQQFQAQLTSFPLSSIPLLSQDSTKQNENLTTLSQLLFQSLFAHRWRDSR